MRKCEYPKNLFLALGMKEKCYDNLSDWEKELILKNIDTLSKRERTAIYLYFKDGLTFKQMAESGEFIDKITKKPTTTAQSTYAVTHKALKK